MPNLTQSYTMDELLRRSRRKDHRLTALGTDLSMGSVRIYNAVKVSAGYGLFSGKKRKEDRKYSSKLKLEKLLEQVVSGNGFVDAGWACTCNLDCDCPAYGYAPQS
jgi:hypothetical protein